MRSDLGFGALLVLTFGAMGTGCHVDMASSCTSGMSRTCTCANGDQGVQSCRTGGEDWASCQCHGDAGQDGSSGTGGSAGDDASTGGSAGDDASTGGSAGDDASTGGSAGDDGSTGGSAGDDGSTGGSSGCGGGTPDDCGGTCVNTEMDPLHCGDCSTICSGSHIPTPSCWQGKCNGGCENGYLDCDSDKTVNGCEYAQSLLASDPDNCGACGLSCSSNHIQSRHCGGGTCDGACAAGFADCDQDKLTNGCEVATSTDAAHCGGCGLACSTSHMASPSCASGVCNGTCEAGWVDCDNDKRSNGCETDALLHACEVTSGPSCAGGLLCGSESCCRNLLVPGGTFLMGRSDAGMDAWTTPPTNDPNEQPEHEVTVAPFYLDAYEVTVARFRNYVDQYSGAPLAAGVGAHPSIPASGWQSAWNAYLPASKSALQSALICAAPNNTWTNTPSANDGYAANCVDWFIAFAFCVWDGGRLPTEAEWEFAAAGGDQNRLYPWGQEPADATRATFSGSTNSPFTNVGTHPAGAGRWLHEDLGGGMWEWTFDWYGVDWYALGGNTCVNCANVSGGSRRIHRGGAWWKTADYMRAAHRSVGSLPEDGYGTVGFRCARDVP